MMKTQTTARPCARKKYDPANLDKWRSEEPALIKAWQDRGCERSLSTLLERYQGFFRSQVNRIVTGRSLPDGHYADLLQEAQLAFIKAVSGFDPQKGCQLSTFVLNHVRPTLLKYALDFRHSYRIGTGSGERKAFYAALSRRAANVQSGKGDVLTDKDIEEIHTRTGASRKSTDRAVKSLYTSQADISDGFDIASEEDPEDHLSSMAIKRAMRVLAPFIAALDERQKAVFDCFLSDRSVPAQDLAERFDVTPERIGQIKRNMLTDMGIYLKQNGIHSNDLF